MILPNLKIFLTPFLNGDESEHTIHVRMIIGIPDIAEDGVILHHVLARGPIKTQQYTTEDVKCWDTEGAIPLSTSDSKDRRQRKFLVSRAVSAGQLIAEYRAKPWNPTASSPCGPQIALERDGGGLTAAGMSFILRPAFDSKADITVSWDLTSTPSGTRAACSLGEGQLISVQAPPAILDECFFAVGPLQSYPAGETLGKFGLYWLEDPPFDALALGRKMEALMPKMTAFFQDADTTYRIFIRRNIQKCISGRGLHRGFVFAWTKVVPRDEDELEEFLMHETVHNWPRLGFSNGGPTYEELADGWWNEGIADYYSIILPYRFGIFSEQEFVRRFNIRISGYYTNPDRNIKNKDVQDQFWNGGHVNRIPYQRGFMYFMKLAYQLKMAGGKSLDDLILAMIDLRNRRDPPAYNIKVWLSMLETELGPDALNDYHSMADAVPIILASDCLRVTEGLNWTLQRQDQEELYLGFPEDCLDRSRSVVKDLDPSSRAAEAGVRNGDIITPQHSLFVIAERWGREFEMSIKRPGSDALVNLHWSPRTRERVESYQLIQ